MDKVKWAARPRFSAGVSLSLSIGFRSPPVRDVAARPKTRFMPLDFSHPILQQPIQSLPLSAGFKLVTEMLGFHTLADLLQKRTTELKKMPGFTQNLAIEYVHFLEKKGLGDYIDP